MKDSGTFRRYIYIGVFFSGFLVLYVGLDKALDKIQGLGTWNMFLMTYLTHVHVDVIVVCFGVAAAPAASGDHLEETLMITTLGRSLVSVVFCQVHAGQKHLAYLLMDVRGEEYAGDCSQKSNQLKLFAEIQGCKSNGKTPHRGGLLLRITIIIAPVADETPSWLHFDSVYLGQDDFFFFYCISH